MPTRAESTLDSFLGNGIAQSLEVRVRIAHCIDSQVGLDLVGNRVYPVFVGRVRVIADGELAVELGNSISFRPQFFGFSFIELQDFRTFNLLHNFVVVRHGRRGEIFRRYPSLLEDLLTDAFAIDGVGERLPTQAAFLIHPKVLKAIRDREGLENSYRNIGVRIREIRLEGAHRGSWNIIEYIQLTRLHIGIGCIRLGVNLESEPTVLSFPRARVLVVLYQFNRFIVVPALVL